jgi:hypothetical protein
MSARTGKPIAAAPGDDVLEVERYEYSIRAEVFLLERYGFQNVQICKLVIGRPSIAFAGPTTTYLLTRRSRLVFERDAGQLTVRRRDLVPTIVVVVIDMESDNYILYDDLTIDKEDFLVC